MPTPKHLCFDLDGTLTTVPEDYPKTIITKTFDTLNLGKPSEVDSNEIWFGSDKDGYIKNVLKLDVPDFWKAFDLFDTPEERAKRTLLFPEILEVLGELQARGHVLSILSGALSWHIQQAVEQMKDIHFKEIMAISYSGYPNKPAPDSLLALVNKMRTSLSETIYVGNGEEDLRLARNAGCDFIYVNRRGIKLPLNDKEIEVNNLKQMLSFQWLA